MGVRWIQPERTETGEIMTNVWVVRAERGKYAENFVEGGYAAGGWLPDKDLTEVTIREEVKKLYQEAHPELKPGQVRAHAGMLARFLLGIKPGDYVVTPLTDTEWLYHGRVEDSESYYSPDSNDECPFPHRWRVKWSEKRVRRWDLSTPFRNTLGSHQTVFRVRHVEELLARIAFDDIRPFLRTNHRGVVTTRRANGATQASIVVCGAYRGNAAFVAVYGKSAKVRNLRRDPNCSVLAVTEDWRSFATVEGQASLFDASNTDAEKLRVLLREVYRVCGDKDHPVWAEYDQAMVDQQAVVVLVKPERVYGLLR